MKNKVSWVIVELSHQTSPKGDHMIHLIDWFCRDTFPGNNYCGSLCEFAPQLWLVTVDDVTVTKNGDMRFRFFDGTEVVA